MPARGSPARSRGHADRRVGVRSAGSRGRRLQLGDRDLLDLAERQLEEPLAELAEALRVAGRQKAIGALAARLVGELLPLERKGFANDPEREGAYRFLTTGDPERFRLIGERFLQLPLGEVEQVAIAELEAAAA